MGLKHYHYQRILISSGYVTINLLSDNEAL
jgi:hypothetical protein